MEDNGGTIKTHIPDKALSEITSDNLRRYDSAALLARTGLPTDPNFMPRNYNERVENRFEGLRLMIAFQQHIISGNNMATVEKNCHNAYVRRYKTEDDIKAHPFDKEENDIGEFKAILEFLDECEFKIEKSIQTKSLDDDFVIDATLWDGSKRKELTKNFFAMYKELIDSYREIYTILLDNKIVTLGLGENADNTQEEIEEELKRRISIA